MTWSPTGWPPRRRPAFEAPGDLGPGYQPSRTSPPSPPPVAVTPAAVTPSPPVDPAPTAATLAPPPLPATPQPDLGTALGDAAGMPGGELGGGLGGSGEGLLGLASRIVDAVGGLLGSAGDELGATDPFEDANAFDADPFEADDTDEPLTTPTASPRKRKTSRTPKRPSPARRLNRSTRRCPADAPVPADAPPPPAAAPVDASAPVAAPPAGEPATADDRREDALRDRRGPASAGGAVRPQAGRSCSTSST